MHPQTVGERPLRQLRILIVPDHLQWVTGTIAFDIKRYNPLLDVAVVSGEALEHHLLAGGELPFRPDVVHLLTEYVGHALQDRFAGRVPLVNSVHHVEDWPFIEPLVAAADAVLVGCNQWRDYLVAQGVRSDKLGMVRYGVDTDTFFPGTPTERAAARTAAGLPRAAFVVGMASKRSSNSSGRKAPEVFEAAVRRLAAVYILGPGWGDLVAGLRRQGVACIHRDFIVRHADLRNYYLCLDAYWVTSRIEGGPVPLLEAMSCGVPGISTPVGIAPEVVRPGVNGALVDIDDVAAFVGQSRALAAGGSPRVAWGEAARAEVVRWMRRDLTAPAAADLYRTAIRHFAARAGTVEPLPDQPDRPAAIRTLRAMDNAFWARDLVGMGVGRQALSYAAAAAAGRPTSPAVWQSLARTYTPGAVRAAARTADRILTGGRQPAVGAGGRDV